MEVLSMPSRPAITWSSAAASLTLRVMGPIWSRLDAKATSPYRETLPYVGFNPTVPHRLAGCRMEPPVSVPRAATQRPAATAAAEPPLEPPGIRDRSHGFFVTWNEEFSVDDPMANSSMLSLPRWMKPLCFIL